MKPKAALPVLLLLVAAGLVYRYVRGPEGVARGRALDRREIALRILGAHLASIAPNQEVLLVANPYSQRPGQPKPVYAFDAAARQGLKAGVGDRLRVVGPVYPDLNPLAERNPGSIPLPPDATTPLSYLTAEKAWDKLRSQYASPQIWVSVIGLPAGLAELDVWRQPKPRLALLLPDLRLAGDAAAVLAAFRSGKIIAAVLNRPGAPPEAEPVRGSPQAELEARFILVTPENAEVVLAAMPNLF
jgi:hypothetical protein